MRFLLLLLSLSSLGLCQSAPPQKFAAKTLDGTVIFRGTQRDAYDTIQYTELYAGVDLSVRVMGGSLKTEFEVRPGGDVSHISWRYKNSTDVDDRRVPVPVSFRIGQDDTVGLVAGPYDTQLPLIINPALTFSTTVGGSGTDVITGVARDAAGNIYYTGWTDSPTFSTVTPTFPRGGDIDSFVMKLNGSTKALVYLAYIGGSGDDRALGIAVDGSGYVYVCGSTTSTNFPVVGAQQATLNGTTNTFLTKLDPTGRKMLFSTYFGGSGDTIANAIALDNADNVYLAGETDSTALPTMHPFQTASGGLLDAFVAKFNFAGVLQYASYLGGAGNDMALGIAVDSAGNAYVAGGTMSANFPVVGALQNALDGMQDAFVTKVDALGSAVVYSTYLGGSGGAYGSPEEANAISVDSKGDAFVAGTTPSADFPILNAYQPVFDGWNSDAFISELNPAGSKLIFSTYLGGSDLDVANSVELDSSGNIYVAGYTASIDFPMVQAIQGTEGGLYDVFVAELGPAGNTLLFSTYFGGAHNDIGYSVAGSNEVIVGGSTASYDKFPGVVGIDVLEFGLTISPVAPFGTVDTPTNNSTGLNGAIGVTGWALCNDQVPSVAIWREPVTGEAQGALVFIGNATSVSGSRPDVAAAYPTYEFNTRGGWGYAILTNELPASAGGSNPIGNGTYQLHAIATNLQGQAVDIGHTTVSVDNKDSLLPFGTIDTPAQGATISGALYYNFGWVVTPKPATIPVNGSTIWVFIDGVRVGHPVYNNYRVDIATLFPGLNNSNGAVGYYPINTTLLTNGVHTIAWSVADNDGHSAGIGSRYFTVQN